jgi:hypothetical protein
MHTRRSVKPLSIVEMVQADTDGPSTDEDRRHTRRIGVFLSDLQCVEQPNVVIR